jgi:hypothetical protein
VKETYVSVDAPPNSEVRNRRRLAMAAAAVVAVIGVAAIAINSINSEDDEEPAPPAASADAPTTAVPTTAAPTTAIPTTTEPVGVPGALPDGTYRIEVAPADFLAVNAENAGGTGSYNFFVGTWEWTFLGGDWSYQYDSISDGVQSTYEGTYNVDGNHITIISPGVLWMEEQEPQEFTWEANPDGSLQFTALPSTTGRWAALLASHPLVPTTS